MQYLATLQQVKDLTTISNNAADKHLAAFLDTAQVLKMKPHLGYVFLNSLLMQLSTQVTVSAATAANPVQITSAVPTDFATGESIYISGATGMVGINGQWTITALSATTFRLDGLDGTAFPAYNVGTATAMRMPAANVLALPKIQKAYAWWVLRDAMPFIWMHVTNSGLANQAGGSGSFGRGDGGQGASKSEMAWLQQNAQALAEGYTSDLRDFLSYHSADYPEWVSSCNSVGMGDVLSGDGTHTHRGKFKKKMGFV